MCADVRGTECRVRAPAPLPPWINGKAARIRADSRLRPWCCTTVSPLRHLVVRGLAQLRNDDSLVSSRSLFDCYFISRAARKSVKISFPRLLTFRMRCDECGGGGEAKESVTVPQTTTTTAAAVIISSALVA